MTKCRNISRLTLETGKTENTSLSTCVFALQRNFLPSFLTVARMSTFVRGHRRHRSLAEINPLLACTTSITAVSSSAPIVRRRALSEPSVAETAHAAQLCSFTYPRLLPTMEIINHSNTSVPGQTSTATENSSASSVESIILTDLDVCEKQSSAHTIAKRDLRLPVPSRRPKPPTELVNIKEDPSEPVESTSILNKEASSQNAGAPLRATKMDMLKRIEIGRRRRFVLQAVWPHGHSAVTPPKACAGSPWWQALPSPSIFA